MASGGTRQRGNSRGDIVGVQRTAMK
jgi:hypothetical protein